MAERQGKAFEQLVVTESDSNYLQGFSLRHGINRQMYTDGIEKRDDHGLSGSVVARVSYLQRDRHSL